MIVTEINCRWCLNDYEVETNSTKVIKKEKRMRLCPNCRKRLKRCAECDGDGEVELVDRTGFVTVVCSKCQGEGVVKRVKK